ncbi:MAG TPA: hypothetical protein VLF66_20325 [Thermoanaerobaculia bacterium]|nr:hypothetical protein [Thermoanaerobaculia bacterium]
MTELQLAWYIAMGGWLVALVQAVAGYLERRDTRRQELLSSALDYLAGGTQKRSVGIALIEGMWDGLGRYHDALIPALTNQAVYLLLHAKNSNSRHEMDNWLRIMRLLTERTNLGAYGPSYGELANALEMRFDPDWEGGLEMSEEQLRAWREKFPGFIGDFTIRDEKES